MKGKEGWNKGKILNDINTIFTKNSNFDTGYVKKVILQLKLKEYKCLKCDISNWNGMELILELDHIDGNRTNNELNNLRFLCPNCHSQTLTFRGRNINNGKQKNIRQALLKVGLSPKGGNYQRVKMLINNMPQ